jgi:hypothetical protein
MECPLLAVDSIGPRNTSGKGRRSERIYLCNYRSHRGATVCSNSLRPRMDPLDREALTAIEQKVLTPPVVEAAITRAVELINARANESGNRPTELRGQLRSMGQTRERLIAAIRLGGGKLESLVLELEKCEAEIGAVRDELAELEQQPTYTDTPAATRVKADLGKRLAAWHDLLQRNVPLARQALRKLLDGPIKFVPEEDGGYRLVGRTVIGSLFDDAAFPPTHAKMASPRGTVLDAPLGKLDWEWKVAA